MYSLITLPTELLCSSKSNNFAGIFNLLDGDSLKTLRCTCRRLRDVSSPLFRDTYFSTIAVSIDYYGLSKLAAISNNRALAHSITTIKWMFDDMSESSAYPDTLEQLRRGHTVGILAMCFDKLVNCHTFTYALRDYDDVTVSLWRSLFSRYTHGICGNDPEDVVHEWLLITLDAMFTSRLRITSLIIDEDPCTIGLPPLWLPLNRLRELHPGCVLTNFDTLQLNINLNAQGDYSKRRLEGDQSFSMFSTAPRRVSLYTGLPEDHSNHRLAPEAFSGNLKAILARPGLEEIVVKSWVNMSFSTFQKLVTGSKGRLKKLVVQRLYVHRHELTNFHTVLTKVTKDNPQLALINLGHHTFQHETNAATLTISLHLRDDRPHAYGSMMLQNELALLKAWMVVAGLDI